MFKDCCFLSPISVITTRHNGLHFVTSKNRSRHARRAVTPPRAVLPAVAAEVAAEVADTIDAAATEAGPVLVDTVSLNMGRLTFALTVFCTFGSIVLTWDEWRKKRNSERSISEWEAAGGEKRPRDGTAKDLEYLFTDNKPPPAAPFSGDNRQTRRLRKKQEALDKKQRKAEDRAKKQKANK